MIERLNTMEVMYKIYKDNKDTERSVGILYKKGDYKDRDRRIANLKADYPVEEGYLLVKEYERQLIWIH